MSSDSENELLELQGQNSKYGKNLWFPAMCAFHYAAVCLDPSQIVQLRYLS